MSYMESMRRVLLQGFTPPLGSYAAGLRDGWREERERIIALLEERAGDWLSHDGSCDCRLKGKEVESVIALIKGENE